MYKRCSKCKTFQSTDNFTNNKTTSSGLSCWCKSCFYIAQKAYRLKNKEKCRLSERAWRLKNPDKVLSQRRAYYKNNKEKVDTQKRDWVLKNQDHVIESRKSQYLKNKVKLNRQMADYHAKNREDILRRHSEYNKKKENNDRIKAYKSRPDVRARTNANRKKRRDTDPAFLIADNCRRRVNESLRRACVEKNDKTFDLIGCSPDFLKKHLESQWTEGMSWSNYGKKGWVIDHIIPVDSFDLTIEEQRLKCYHWSNQQPLWWKPNLMKLNKILSEEELEKLRQYAPTPGEIITREIYEPQPIPQVV